MTRILSRAFCVYDFDKGGEKCPKDESRHYEWRTKQTQYWLDVASENFKRDLGTIIFGLCRDPQFIIAEAKAKGLDASKLKFAYLVTHSEERKKRLFDRGTPHHWQGEKPWYKEFYQQLEKAGATEFDTTNKKIGDLAGEITVWLLK